MLFFQLGNRLYSKITTSINMRFTVLIIITFISLNVGAQNYKKSICQHRKEYKAEFKEEGSPLKTEEIRYLDFFKPDEKYSVIADFKRTFNEKPFDMVTSSGKKKRYAKYGELSFQLDGKTIVLEVYQSLKLMAMPQYKEYLFLPFKDATNGNESYGAGRYIDFEMSDIKDDKVSLDFNKAYNPYCAYTDGYNCPYPPQANHLDIPVYAGEKVFKKKS